LAALIGASPIAAGGVVARPPLQAIANPSRPLDETGDSTPDIAETLAQRFSRRAEAALVAQQSEQQQLQLRLDRVRASFNASQEMRAERLRGKRPPGHGDRAGQERRRNPQEIHRNDLVC